MSATPSSFPHLLSIDLGRTSSKACVSRDPEKVVLVPANVKEGSYSEISHGGFDEQSTDPLLDIWLQYDGQHYAVGQLAADLRADLGVGRSKVQDALVRMLACVGLLQVKEETMVVLGIPYLSQETFEKEKTEITRLLLGDHQMTFRGRDLIPLSLSEVWVVPEGYGSLIWAEAQGKPGVSFKDLSVAIVDIGHQTTDFLMVDRFRFARGVSSSENFAMSQFYELVANQIEGADAQSLSLIEAVHKPKGERLYRPRGAKKPTNLDELLPNLRRNFATEISNRLLDWLPERATEVIITGGGGEFFWDELLPLMKEAGLKAHLADPSRKANVLGQFLYGEMQLQKMNLRPASAGSS